MLTVLAEFARAPGDYPLLVTSSTLILLTGIVLFLIAWRGRRIDDHPLCRRCKFDLIGVPPEAEKCSECGADLKYRRALLFGHRETRWGWMLLGLVLILENGSWLSVQGRHALRNVNWNDHKPVWWLLHDARSTKAQRSEEALEKLTSLALERKLSTAQKAELVQTLLAAQADPQRAFGPSLDACIINLYNYGHLSERDWRTYWTQGLGLTLVVRRQIQRGEPLPLLITPMRTPRLLQPYWKAAIQVDELSVSGTAIPVALNVHQPLLMAQVNSLTLPLERTADLKRVLPHLSDGPHTLECVALITMRPAAGRVLTDRYEPVEIPLRGEFFLVPRGQPVVELATPQEHRLQLVQSLGVDQIFVQERRGTRGYATTISVNARRPPVDISFDVFFRYGPEETPLGTLLCVGGRTRSITRTITMSELHGDTAELVLRPNAIEAAKTTQIEEIWGEELVLENLAVYSAQASPNPTQQASPRFVEESEQTLSDRP